MSILDQLKTRESYMDKFPKGSRSAISNEKAALNSFDKFCGWKFRVSAESVIRELAKFDEKKQKSTAFSMLQTYSNYLVEEQQIAIGTAKQYSKSVKNYINYMLELEISNEQFRREIKFSRQEIRDDYPLSPEEARALLAESRKSNTDATAKDLLKKEPIYENITEYLKNSLNLELDITGPAPLSLDYSFGFTGKNNIPHTIPQLSSGERGIVHFIFSIFGYDLENGLMIIDEPELHIHPQMQEKYIRIILSAQEKQSMQFIVATHSPTFVTPETILGMHRFHKDGDGFTHIITGKKIIDADIDLVRILRYTDSSKIFFSNKVILVEGDTDEYFYKSFYELYKIENLLDLDIEFLQIRGRSSYFEWKTFLEKYEIPTYFIGDLDNILREDLPVIETTTKTKFIDEFLKEKSTLEKINANKDYHQKSKLFRSDLLDYLKSKKSSEYATIISAITGKYSEGVFILKEGDLENYLGISKGLKNTVHFCKNDLVNWYGNTNNKKIDELKNIFEIICK